MSMREDFEMWVLAHWSAQSLDRFTTGEYTGHMVEHAWIAWQASRESVSGKIPSMSSAKYLEYYPDVEGGCFNRQAYIDDLVIALQAAGLRFIP